MGVAGGAGSGSAVVLAGIAGLVAGAFSMALGEWLSVTNARELYTSQIATERAELEANPDEEREELALIYQAKGIPQDEAETMAAHIVANADAALDRLAREELGIDPDELGGSAMTAAATSFGLFAFGAAIPLVPLMAFKENTALVGSMIAAGIGLLAFGAAAALVTGQGLWRGALRQLAIGGVAAGATFSIGKLVGQTVGA
jgi:VIT1/CCC1 family predicted Fe2+/Mn2+ transporter